MEKYGIKNLYQAALKAGTDMEILGIKYSAGDTLLYFDNIQEMVFNEDREEVAARGGWNNREHVIWEITHSIAASMNMGVINKLGYGLVNKVAPQHEVGRAINQIENVEVEDDTITLLHSIDTSKPIIVWEVEDGAIQHKILDFSVQDNTIILEEPIENNVLVDYWYQYDSGYDILSIGKKDINGYLQFVGKFYYTDEYSGVNKTGLIEIPQLRISSNFDLRFGRNTNPFISVLNFEAIPNGDRGDGKAVEIIYLDSDIDADI